MCDFRHPLSLNSRVQSVIFASGLRHSTVGWLSLPCLCVSVAGLVVHTLIRRILASNRSCFTARWAIIKLLLALLLDMTTAVGVEKVEKCQIWASTAGRKLTQTAPRLEPDWETLVTQRPAPSELANHFIGLYSCQSKKLRERHAPCTYWPYYEFPREQSILWPSCGG